MLADAAERAETPDLPNGKAERADRPMKIEDPGAPAQQWGRAMLIIVLISIVADLVFFSGFYASDDIQYLTGVRKILEDGSLGEKPLLGQKRLAIVSWNVLIAFLFDYKVQIIAGSYILFHQLANLLTFLLARRVFDRTVGLVAAYTTALFPVMVIFSSEIMPDILLASCILASLLLFIRSYDLRDDKRPLRSWLLMFAAGLVIGMGYLSKESGLLLLPYFFVFWLIREPQRFRGRALLTGTALVLGFAAVALVEYGAYSYLTGKPFFRMGWTIGTSEFPPWLIKKLEAHATLAERVQWLLEETHPTFYPNLMKIAFIASIPICACLRPRLRWSVIVLALWLFIYYTVGTESLTHYLPPTIQARYYIVIVPLIIIVYSAAVVSVLRLLGKLLPLRVLDRPKQLVGLILVSIPLAMGLRGIDVQAGNNYWSHLVNATNRAIAFARSQADRPVIVSRAIDDKLHEALFIDPPPWLLSARDVTAEKLTELAEVGGCYYLEVDRDSPLVTQQALRRRRASSESDQMLHEAIWDDLTDGRLHARELGMFNSWASRWDTLKLHLFQTLDPNAPPTPGLPEPSIVRDIPVAASRRFTSPERARVYLYEVTSDRRVPAEPMEVFGPATIRMADASPVVAQDAESADLGNWAVQGSAEFHTIAGDDGGKTLEFALQDDQQLVIAPPEAEQDTTWNLAAGSIHLVCFQAAITGKADARLSLNVADTGIGRGWDLPDGHCVTVAVETGESDKLLRPAITLSGSGTVGWKAYVLSVAKDTAAARALLDLASGSPTAYEIPFQAEQDEEGALTIPGWHVTADTGRFAITGDVGSRARIEFEQEGRGAVLVMAHKSVTRAQGNAPANGTLLLGIEMEVGGDPSGSFGAAVYDHSSLQGTAVAVSRVALGEPGMYWFAVHAHSVPLYVRPVMKLREIGSASVKRCIVISSAAPALTVED